MICPKCGSKNIRAHCHYVERTVDFYLCEDCEYDWTPIENKPPNTSTHSYSDLGGYERY